MRRVNTVNIESLHTLNAIVNKSHWHLWNYCNYTSVYHSKLNRKSFHKTDSSTDVAKLQMYHHDISCWVNFNIALKDDPGGTRTHNPQLRRLMPYPLGHWALFLGLFIHSFISWFMQAKLPKVSEDWQFYAKSSRLDSLWIYHPWISCSVNLNISPKNDPGGTWTHNPQLRRLMPYPLGHRALSLVKLEVFTHSLSVHCQFYSRGRTFWEWHKSVLWE